MLSRVSCARAARESTANDIFIFPKQWKYKIIRCASQMLTARQQVFHSSCDQMPDAVPTQSERRWAWVRLVLGLAQMFGAVFSVTLLVRTGVTAVALIAVALTGVLTTVSVLLFGARRSKRERS
jgi:hypothetical protein